MNKPIEPKPPSKPKKKESYIINKSVDVKYKSLAEILEKIPESIDKNKVKFDVGIEHEYGEDYSYCNMEWAQPMEFNVIQSEYDKSVEKYNKDYIKYLEKLDKYKLDLTAYDRFKEQEERKLLIELQKKYQ